MLVITQILRDMIDSHGDDSPVGALAAAYFFCGKPEVLKKLHMAASPAERMALESAFGTSDLNPTLQDVLNEAWASALEAPILEMHLRDGCAIDCWKLILKTDCAISEFGSGEESDVETFREVAKRQIRVFYFG